DPQKAKSFLSDLYAFDPDYSLDTQQFSPKVMTLAAQAKAEQDEIRCQAARTDARKRLTDGNAKASLDLIGSMKDKCDGLDVLEAQLADLFYRLGPYAYKRGVLPGAMEEVQATLGLVTTHARAVLYSVRLHSL